MKIIKNTTPYIGRLYLKFEKYPEYSGSSILNKVHLNLGFIKLVTRVIPNYRKDIGWEVNQDIVKEIENKTGGFIRTYKFDHGELPNSFVTKNNEYIGDIKWGLWYIKNNLKVYSKYPHGVAIKYNKEGNIEGYVGYTHRGSTIFRIGDYIFDDKFNMDEFHKDFKHYKKELKKAKYSSRIEEVIPFNKRGNIEIKNWKQAAKAAVKLSKYLN